MIKKLFIAVLMLVTPFVASADLQEVSCFDDGLYTFQSVTSNIGVVDSSYDTEDVVKFIGQINNDNPYPVFDGNLFVRIARENSNYLEEGHNIVDEFIIEDVNINGSSTLPIEFDWEVQDGLASGEYRADFFFSVGKKFNLGGLPFTNEILMGYTKFEIIGRKDNGFYLGKGLTRVNSEKYLHIGEWPSYSGDISVEQALINDTNSDLEVNVEYTLSYWDSINSDDLIDKTSEIVTVPANSSIDLSYIIPDESSAVNYLRIEAKVGNTKSIVNVRVADLDESKARLNYPGVNNFPLEKGDSFNPFSCYHLTGGDFTNVDGEVRLSIEDGDGNEIYSSSYSGEVSGEMLAVSDTVVAESDVTNLVIKSELITNGQVVDSYEVEYSCDLIDNEKCFDLKNKHYTIKVIGYSLISLLLVYIAVVLVNKMVGYRNVKVFIKIIAAITAIGILAIAIYALYNKPSYVEAQNFPDGQPVTKTSQRSKEWAWGWENPNGRPVARGNISYTKVCTLNTPNQDTRIGVGDNISISLDNECTHNAHSYNWDTPYCEQNADTFHSPANDRDGYIKFRIVDIGVGEITSSNSEVLTCDSSGCSAVSPGNAQVQYRLEGIHAYAEGCAEVNGGRTCHDSSTLAYNRKLRLSNNGSWNPDTFKDTRLRLGDFTCSWNIEVGEPVPSDGVCGSADGKYVSSQPSQSQLCSSGTPSSVTANGDGTYSWSCEGRNGSNVDDICSTINNPLSNGGGGDDNDSGLACRISQPSDGANTYSVGEEVTFTAVLSGASSEDVDFQWDGDLVSGAGDVQSVNVTLNDQGTYQGGTVRATLNGETQVATCITGLFPQNPTLNQRIIVAEEPELTFDISPQLADPESGTCPFTWGINAGASEVSCRIETKLENGSVYNGLSQTLIGQNFSEDGEIESGNEYRLVCDYTDPLISDLEITPTPYQQCIDPDLIEI